ncbi:MAG: GNAT family N-acetyltransferase [Nitrospiria bacterium]
MAIEVREGYPVDPSTLQALYEYAPWAQGRAVDGIRKMLEHTDYHFSAWDGKKLIGFARVLTDRIYRATLWDVVVHPDYQRQGVGEELMNRILSHPVLSTVEKFWLNTRDMFGFYEKFGFVRSDQGMVRENPQKRRAQ